MEHRVCDETVMRWTSSYGAPCIGCQLWGSVYVMRWTVGVV